MAAVVTGPEFWAQIIQGLWDKGPPPQPLAQPAPYQTAQGGNETNLGYGARRAVQSPLMAIANIFDSVPTAVQNNPVGRDIRAGAKDLLSTPNQRKAGSGAGAFPKSFSDPAYDAVEAAVAQGYGNPTLADGLARLRMLGERSNADQVNKRTGASTPYQITASTRKLIMDKHGFDPWSSPANAARGAAIAMTAYTGANANFNDPRVLAKAAGGYFGGKAGADNPFGSISDGNNTVAQYTQRVLGQDTPLPFPALNPFDPTYDKMALGVLQRGRQAALSPSHYSMDMGPAPEMPKPEAIPTTDFSKSDADLAAMRPMEMSLKEQHQRETQGFWKGISQALMQTPGNEGIGTFLMRLGGAALGGRLSADDDIRKEQDKFADKLASWQAATFNNDLAKAKVSAAEAQAQIQQNNQYNLDNWKLAYDRWSKGSQIDVSGDKAVIRRTDPGGKVTVDVLPIESAVNAAFAQQTASLLSGMGGRQFAGNQQITSMTNALTARAAINSMTGNGAPAEKDAAAAAAPAFYGTFIATHGLAGDLLGADGLKSLEKSIGERLMQAQMQPGTKDYTDAHDRMMATEIAKLGAARPDIMNKMMSVGSVANSFQALDAVQKGRTTTSTDDRGRTSSRTTMPLAADVFSSDDFNDQLASHGYSRY